MKNVTLSFDNGPTPGITERVLEILEKNRIKTTFMVIGNNLRSADGLALLGEITAAGHWVGNHSLTHSVAFGDRPDAAYAKMEIGETQRLIGDCAHPNKFFRPFGNLGNLGPHLLSEAALAYLQENAFSCVLWNSVPHDWDDPDGWVERGIADVRAKPWTVIVVHDIQGAAVSRLEEFIGRLRDEGVRFTQTFPKTVLATWRGRVLALPDDYVRERA
jgi:peptidoglycan-N-acetylglucosamine deacetylase